MIKFLLVIALLFLSVTIVSASDTLEPEVTVSVSVDDTATFTGTASDDSNDVNVTSGISRVELRVDGGSWVTATGTTSWSYEEEDLEDGSHVVSVRAFDRSNNPSDILIESFEIDYTDLDDTELSWYINIDDFEFRTLSSISVRSITPKEDVCVCFEIENEYDSDRRLKYTISIGTYEIEDTVAVKAGKSTDVEEWVDSSIFDMGLNRIEVEVVDKQTQEQVIDKTYTLTVVEEDEESDESDSGSGDIPTWFVSWAEVNGFAVQEDDSDVAETLGDMDSRLASLETQYNAMQYQVSSAQSATSTEDDGSGQIVSGIDNIYLLIAIAVLVYLFRERLGLVKSKEEEYDYSVESREMPAPEELQDG